MQNETAIIVQLDPCHNGLYFLDQYRRILINFVFPTIKTKWPLNSTQEKIKIQQDNGRPHI